MLINIDDLSSGDVREISFSEIIEIPESYSEFTQVPTQVKGKLSKVGGGFRFEGRAVAVLRLRCDRCLSEFSKKLEFDCSGNFRKKTETEEDDFEYEGAEIDLAPAVLSGLLVEFPMKNVCREDCKGLCIKCGHNLNLGECGCDRRIINPEFEKLKELFDQEV